MFIFNNTEEKWFLSWVVLRRKFLVSEAKNKEKSKIIQDLRNTENDLRHEISDLKRNRNKLMKIEILESENRKKMIENFNREHNKINKKKKRKTNRKWK